jgi:hypothetical protein
MAYTMGQSNWRTQLHEVFQTKLVRKAQNMDSSRTTPFFSSIVAFHSMLLWYYATSIQEKAGTTHEN